MEMVVPPDKQFFIYKGFICNIDTNSLGALCGSVIIPNDHLLFSKNRDSQLYNVFKIHGGLPFTANFINTEIWVVGFHCSHYDDLSPLALYDPHDKKRVLRKIPFVENEITLQKNNLRSIRKM